MEQGEQSTSNGDKKEESSMQDSTKSEPKKKDIETLIHHLYIAHELAISEDLNIYTKFAKEKQSSDEDILRTSLREAYWNLFREQISEDPPNLEMAFDLLTEIKKGLEIVMTPNITKLRDQVSQVLDLETLRTQAEHGAIDVMYYAKYIISVMGKICAPVRDKDVANLNKETDVVNLFKSIMDILILMKFDLLNFSLAVIKPDIIANHLAYERDTFKEYVAAIGGDLPKTSKWLKRHRGPMKDALSIVQDGFLEMLVWVPSDEMPETLFLEEERLRKLRLEYFRLTVSCTLHFLSVGLLPKELQTDEAFKEFLKDLISVLMSETRSDRQVEEFAKNIAAEIHSKTSNLPGKSQPPISASEEFDLYQDTISQAANPENKVRTLVCTRVNDYLRTSLKVKSSSEDHFPTALNLYKKELNFLRGLYESIFNHNLLVCMEHYSNLLAGDNEKEQPTKTAEEGN